MPIVHIKMHDKIEKSTRYVSEGIVDSEFSTTMGTTDSVKISGEFSSITDSPSTEGRVEVEENSTV